MFGGELRRELSGMSSAFQTRSGPFPHTERTLKMNVRTSLLGAALLAACVVPAFSEIMPQAELRSPAPAVTAPRPRRCRRSPAASGSRRALRVMVGKSLLINTTERLRRISVTDPSIAFAQVITPTQILVHGTTPGEVSLLIWDEAGTFAQF